MRLKYLIILLLLAPLACNSNKEDKSESTSTATGLETKFDKANWQVKEDSDYPFRAQMLDDIVYNDTVRSLNKEQILELLGKPDRINDGHLYYLIVQKRVGSWPLKTKSMVIKLSDKNTIEWIKIHG